jgi:hypothetical protein
MLPNYVNIVYIAGLPVILADLIYNCNTVHLAPAALARKVKRLIHTLICRLGDFSSFKRPSCIKRYFGVDQAVSHKCFEKANIGIYTMTGPL